MNFCVAEYQTLSFLHAINSITGNQQQFLTIAEHQMSNFSHAFNFELFFPGVQTSIKWRTFFDFSKPNSIQIFQSRQNQTNFDQTKTIQITTIQQNARQFWK